MKGGLGNIMKQAQRMQENMQKPQAELADKEKTGHAGGGMVSVVITGSHEIKRVAIDAGLMKEDEEMLEDMQAAAVNDAVRQIESRTQEKMPSVTAGMGLPAGMKMPC